MKSETCPAAICQIVRPTTIDSAAKMFFGVIRIIVRAAPVGAFGAMAFTIGQYGIGSLVNLGALMKRASQNFDSAAVLSVVVLICLLGLIAQSLINMLESHFLRWHVRT